MGAVVDNVKDLHCGAINVDASRINFQTDGSRKTTKRTPRDDDAVWSDKNSGMKKENSLYADADPRGRFPANLLLSESVVGVIDGQSGVLAKGNFPSKQTTTSMYMASKGKSLTPERDYGDIGGASRYFKVLK